MNSYDLGLIGRATGNLQEFARLMARTRIAGHDLHIMIDKERGDYIAIAFELDGDIIVAEHRMAVVWKETEEIVRLKVLEVYVGQILKGADAHRRRYAVELARIVAARGEPL